MLLYDKVTRLRAPLVSAGYGNQERNWAAATSDTFLVHWSAKSEQEVVGDEARTVSQVRILANPDLDLQPTDRIVFGGVTYEVDGEIMRSFRRGQLHHLRASLRRIATS